MAIRHIRILARKLAAKYLEIQDMCLGYAELAAKTCLSDEDFQEYSKARSAVDAECALLSVSLSASVDGTKFKNLKAQVAAPVKQFSEELEKVSRDLAKADAPAQTKEVADLYKSQLQIALRTQQIVETIEFYRNIQSNKRASRKALRDFLIKSGYSKTSVAQSNLASLMELCLTIINPFSDADIQLQNFADYLEEAQECNKDGEAGDLDE